MDKKDQNPNPISPNPNPISLENGWHEIVNLPSSVGRNPYSGLEKGQCKVIYTTVSTEEEPGSSSKKTEKRIIVGCIGRSDEGLLYRLGKPPKGVIVVK